MNNLWQQYQANKAARKGMYFPREGAADLGVSEGALMADAPQSVYLGSNIRDVVLKLHALGEVQCVVRNDVCVHEKQGVYENVSLAPTSGIALNIGGIDLRIFPARWQHVLAVTNRDGGKVSRSIQFYDEFGTALQKVNQGKIIATGTPQDVMREDLLQQVYHWPIRCIRDGAGLYFRV